MGSMHLGIKLIAVLTVLAAAAVSAAPPQKSKGSIKCWINKNGVRECGNTVPAEYVQQGHSKLNAQGIEVGRQLRAQTAEEREAEKRQLALKQEEERKATQTAQADRVLLDTFSSEDDLLLAREGKLSSIEGQIKLTESHVQKLQANLDKLIGSAADFERGGKEPPEKIQAELKSLRQQIEQQRAFIEAKRQEQAAIGEKFDADLKRFRALNATR